MMSQPKAKMQRLPRKQLSELRNSIELKSRNEPITRLSEPKSMNRIKINKQKLPLDFFPKKDLSARKAPIRGPYQDGVSEAILSRKA